VVPKPTYTDSQILNPHLLFALLYSSGLLMATICTAPPHSRIEIQLTKEHRSVSPKVDVSGLGSWRRTFLSRGKVHVTNLWAPETPPRGVPGNASEANQRLDSRTQTLHLGKIAVLNKPIAFPPTLHPHPHPFRLGQKLSSPYTQHKFN